MKNRIFSVVLALILTFALFPTLAFAADPWWSTPVSEAGKYGKNIVPEHLNLVWPDGGTELTDNRSRSETPRLRFAMIAIGWVEYALGKPIAEVISERGLTVNYTAFSDTTDPYVLAAYTLGIVSGTKAPTATERGTFAPWDSMTREQAAVMVRNACRVVGMDISNTAPAGFADAPDISGWAIDAVNFVRNNGIMNGTSVTPLLFSPKATYTYAQTVTTFNNIQLDHTPEPRVHVDYGGLELRLEESIVLAGIMSFQEKYPHGMSVVEYSDHWYEFDGRRWQDSRTLLSCDQFVNEISAVVFPYFRPGTGSYVAVRNDDEWNIIGCDYSKIRIGDSFVGGPGAGGAGHTAIIIAVNGSKITLAEANFNKIVSWTRVVDLEDCIKKGIGFDIETFYE